MTYHEARRKALEFAATILENDSVDVIWGDALIGRYDDEAYWTVLEKAQKAAVASIRRLLK